jgi:hypothetical protein
VIILGIVVLLGTWFFVVGYEFLEKENALWQKKVKAAKEEQQHCEARYTKYRSFDQFRTSIRLPYTSDLSLERWMQQFDTLHAGMSESEVGDRFTGSTWQYEVAVPQDLANDGQNSSLQIFFGPDGKVMDKGAMNMQAKPSATPALAAATPTPVSAVTPEASPSPVSSPNVAAPSPTATPSATLTPSATPAAMATPSPQ